MAVLVEVMQRMFLYTSLLRSRSIMLCRKMQPTGSSISVVVVGSVCMLQKNGVVRRALSSNGQENWSTLALASAQRGCPSCRQPATLQCKGPLSCNRRCRLTVAYTPAHTPSHTPYAPVQAQGLQMQFWLDAHQANYLFHARLPTPQGAAFLKSGSWQWCNVNSTAWKHDC